MDVFALISGFGTLTLTVLAFVAALSIVVFVHEYGHYIVGRWSGIHAEVFSIGFGPVLTSRIDKRGTRWQVAALPFGGYVKFLGDGDAASATADEAFLDRVIDTEREKELRRTMLGAPLWARAATVAAGPIFNFILAAFVFAGIFLYDGQAVEPPTVDRVASVPPEFEAGDLLPGDTIVGFAGQDVADFGDLREAAEAAEPAPLVEYRVRRGDAELTVPGPWPYPVRVGTVTPDSAAIDAGIEADDLIVSVDGTRLVDFQELIEVVTTSEGAPLDLTIWRDGELLEKTLTARPRDFPTADGGFERRWMIGLSSNLAFEPATERVGPIEAIGRGATQVVNVAWSSLSALGAMVAGTISTCNMSGPIGIAEASHDMASQGVQNFIWWIAVLSTAIGLMNLFPIPVLDGGHLVFHAYEAVVGRPPSEAALRVLMGMGLALILGLMAFAITNDIFCP